MLLCNGDMRTWEMEGADAAADDVGGEGNGGDQGHGHDGDVSESSDDNRH